MFLYGPALRGIVAKGRSPVGPRSAPRVRFLSLGMARQTTNDLALTLALAYWWVERYLQKLDSVPRSSILSEEGVPINVIAGHQR
jgi:hypothetical protein